MNLLDPPPAKRPPPLPAHRHIGVFQWVQYSLEFFFILIFWGLLRALPHAAAVRLLGGLAASIGPRSRASGRIRRNLALIYPDMDELRREEIVTGVWRMMGQIMSDYVHRKALETRPEIIEIVGAEHLDRVRGKSAFFFSGHLSTFEVARYAVRRHGIGLNLIYRAFNNPLVDALVWRMMWSPDSYLLHKGPKSGTDLLRLIRQGLPIFMLVDQRLRTGIDVPFLGQPAKSPHAMATLALKYELPMIPVRVERIATSRFRVTFEAPLEISPTGDHDADIHAITKAANARIEAWIHQRPEQWFWLHRRWTDPG